MRGNPQVGGLCVIQFDSLPCFAVTIFTHTRYILLLRKKSLLVRSQDYNPFIMSASIHDNSAEYVRTESEEERAEKSELSFDKNTYNTTFPLQAGVGQRKGQCMLSVIPFSV
jgi:hypothetical protein